MGERLLEHPGVALGIRLAHQDVAHRAQPPGPRAGARGRLEQRHELEPERAPAEREHLGDDHARAQLLEQRQQPVAAHAPGSASSIGRSCSSSRLVKARSLARTGGSWTSSTPPPTSQGAGVPPLATITAQAALAPSPAPGSRRASDARCRAGAGPRTGPASLGLARERHRRRRARAGRPDGSAARSPRSRARRSGGLLAHVPAGGEHERGADHALVADRHDRLPDRPRARRAAPAGAAHTSRGLSPPGGRKSRPRASFAAIVAGRLARSSASAPALRSAPVHLDQAMHRCVGARPVSSAAVSRARRSGLVSRRARAQAAGQPPRRDLRAARAPRARDRRGPGSGRSRSMRSGRGGSSRTGVIRAWPGSPPPPRAPRPARRRPARCCARSLTKRAAAAAMARRRSGIAPAALRTALANALGSRGGVSTPLSPVGHHLGHAALAPGDHRQPGRLGLEQGHAVGLAHRRPDVEVAPRRRRAAARPPEAAPAKPRPDRRRARAASPRPRVAPGRRRPPAAATADRAAGRARRRAGR